MASFTLFKRAPVAIRTSANPTPNYEIQDNSTKRLLNVFNVKEAEVKEVAPANFRASSTYTNAEAYAFRPFVRPKAPHEQALVNGLGLVGMKALRFLTAGEDLELEGPHGAIRFLEDLEAGNGLEKLKFNNPVAFDKLEKLQQLVAVLAPQKGILFNPKPHGFDHPIRPSGPR